MKGIKIKTEICDCLCDRKRNMEKVIGLFFGEGSSRRYGVKKYKVVYNTIMKNLNKLDNDKLIDFVKDVEGMIGVITI